MNFIKKIISLIVMLVFLVNLFLLPTYLIVRDFISYENISEIIDKEDILSYEDASGKTIKEVVLKQFNVDKRLYKYVEMEEVFNNYLKELVKVKLNGEEMIVTLDINEVNKVANDALDKYLIDNNLEEASSLIEINISEADLRYVEEELDSNIDVLFARNDVKALLRILNDDSIMIILIIGLISELVILGLINFSVAEIFKWVTAPTMFVGIIFGIFYFLSKTIVFSGSFESGFINLVLNNLRDRFGVVGSILFILSILMIVMIFISEKLDKKIASHRGIKTLDNFFDDYNSDQVVEELKRREQEELEQEQQEKEKQEQERNKSKVKNKKKKKDKSKNEDKSKKENKK